MDTTRNVTIDMSPLTPKMKALDDAIGAARDAWDDLISSVDELTYTYEEETN